MKQILIMNKNTGDVGVGVKVNFFEKWTEDREIAVLGEHSIGLIPRTHDGWIVKVSEDSEWIYVTPEMVETATIELGEI